MHSELFGHADGLGWVVVKACVLLVLVVVGFRFGARRTFAQLNAFDFAVAVALGAIIGRTATSDTSSLLTGVVALVTLLLAHMVITKLRRHLDMTGVVDQPPNVLVVDGELQAPGLARAGLTEGDVCALLREHGVDDRHEVRVMLYEARGSVSVRTGDQPLGPLMRDALHSAGYPA